VTPAVRDFTIVEAEQRSPDWYAARAGRITASKADALTAMGRGGKESTQRRDYRTQLALERILGTALDDGGGFQNADMRRGVELEPEAFALFEAVTGLVVRRTGFLAHNELPIGVSLDGDVDDCAALVELKAPRPAIHLGYIEADVVPSDYLPQITHGQLVTGASLTYFVSYCPQFPPELQLFIKQHRCAEVELVSYRLLVDAFLREVTAEEQKIRAFMAAKAAA
jgi:predicted phage-related endonuclease